MQIEQSEFWNALVLNKQWVTQKQVKHPEESFFGHLVFLVKSHIFWRIQYLIDQKRK